MKNVISCLRVIGESHVQMGVFLIELFFALWLALAFVRLRQKKEQEKEAKRDKNLFYKRYFTELSMPQFLMRRKDLYPVYLTKSFEEIFHLNAEQFRADAKQFWDGMEPEQAKRVLKQYKAWDGNGSFEAQIRLANQEAWYRLAVVRSEDGAYDCFRFLDITKEREHLEELTKQLEQEEEASRSKTTFLSKMSHEIRTPMNGIIGMLTLAHGQLHGHPAENYIDRAESLSGYLLSVLNDILDMSRIEAGKVELEKKPFDLVALGEKLKDLFQKNVEAKGVQFSVEMQDFDVRYVIGDELRLSQVLVNFLSNSLKFTSQGEIRVIFRQLLRENGNVSLLMRVHDTGCGMDAAFLNRIFLPFEQESIDTGKEHGGSGLGMAIADNLVRLMGGEIVVDSMPGKGSDFTVYVSFPVAWEGLDEVKQQADDTENVAEFTYEGCRILLAEDNEVNAEIAVSILENYGAKVDLAEDGGIAVQKFADAPAGTYDFILMDIQMPVLDGREATRQIRAMARPDAKTIPVFALSADAFVEDQRLSLESGMNGHFSKPIDFEKMRLEIGKIIKRR